MIWVLMAEQRDRDNSSLIEIRKARDQAEALRDQLSAEYQNIRDHESDLPITQDRKQQGLEKIRKAVQAANVALASIEQALSDMERVKDD